MLGWLAALKQLFRRPRPQPTPVAPPAPVPVTPQSNAELRNAVFTIINATRSSHGLVPYAHLPALEDLAQRRAEDPTVAGSDPHQGFSAAFEATFQNVQGGEIIAPGYANPAAAVDAWMNEKGLVKPHKDAILSRAFTHLGIGVADHGGTRCWVGCLIKQVTQSPPQDPARGTNEP